SSVAYWYSKEPARIKEVPPVEKRLPVMKDHHGKWLLDPSRQIKPKQVKMTDEMKRMKKRWAKSAGAKK
ncbi:MAG: hypothetical protein NC902_07480, partial [Candidatus Omnitrophica bacterium]|nr:hypothetical protein [Candidatus Omnitrophota bacterium]